MKRRKIATYTLVLHLGNETSGDIYCRIGKNEKLVFTMYADVRFMKKAVMEYIASHACEFGFDKITVELG